MMSFWEGLWAFIRAVLVGTFVAAALVAAVFLVGGIISSGFAGGLIPIVLTAFFGAAGITLVLGLAGGAFIGLPATVILKRMNAESAANYGFSGAISGFLLTLVGLAAIGSDLDGFWLAGLGALVGIVISQAWWSYYRQYVAGSDGYRSSTNLP